MNDENNEVISEIEKNTKLTPEQKKTIIEWIKYLGGVMIKAIAKKILGCV